MYWLCLEIKDMSTYHQYTHHFQQHNPNPWKWLIYDQKLKLLSLASVVMRDISAYQILLQMEDQMFLLSQIFFLPSSKAVEANAILCFILSVVAGTTGRRKTVFNIFNGFTLYHDAIIFIYHRNTHSPFHTHTLLITMLITLECPQLKANILSLKL